MKKKILVVALNSIIIIVGLGLLALIFGPFALWNQKQPTTMNIWIVDKTVPNTDYREHTGLLWLLNSKKINSNETTKSRNINDLLLTHFVICHIVIFITNNGGYYEKN